MCRRNGCHRICDIMVSGYIQMEIPEQFAFIIYIKGILAVWLMDDIFRLPVRAVRQSEGFYGAVQSLCQLCHVFNRLIDNQCTLRRDTLCKGMEGAADIRKVFEIIQMVAFHIQNHADEGLELQKAVEIFACLGNEIRRVTDFQVTADGRQDAANRNGGVCPCGKQDFGNHGCGCSLAMCACNGNGILIFRHDFAQQSGSVHQGDMLCLRRLIFGVIRMDCRGIDH